MVQAKITTAGKKKLCQAHAGTIQLPKIAYMGFGTGGVNEHDEVIPVIGNETALRTEALKKEITRYEFISETSCKYFTRLEKSDLINQFISEMGLYDEDGDLVVYETFLKKGKDDGLEFIFNITEIF